MNGKTCYYYFLLVFYKYSNFIFFSFCSLLVELKIKILKVLNLSIEDTGLNLEKVAVNDNPSYVKSIQILNSANEQELEFYYGLLKKLKKVLTFIKKIKENFPLITKKIFTNF